MEQLQPQSFSHIYAEFDIGDARRLGGGGFGQVYLLQRKVDGRLFAAKYQKLSDRKAQRLVQREAQFLLVLSTCPRVVTFYGYYEKERHSLLVTEYLQGGELFSIVGSKNYELTEEKCKKFVVEIVKGLNYVHSQEIVHLDIKPQNIMLVDRREQFKLKLIDFGLAKHLIEGRVRIGFAGTVGFMAPEVAHCQYGQNQEELASPATDMFSLGVVVYMLVSGGREPFWDVNEIRTIRNTVRRDPSFVFREFKYVSGEAKDFIAGLLEKQQRKRLTGRQCLNHPWLEQDPRHPGLSDRTLHKLETLRMRRFMARYRWKKAIKAVRMMVKVKNQLAGFPHDL
eukprot:GFUD01002887.1.p1 GENE.GFUD01002887.1~~GFUD01002887.1.p1  ORF type:complete len:339 (+),score=130.30 GFUD01002887.1:140-1156(+)